MNPASAFTGVVEALTFEEWAVRLRVSSDHLKKHYRGPVVRIGANVRIYSRDMHLWLDSLSASVGFVDAWEGVGDT